MAFSPTPRDFPVSPISLWQMGAVLSVHVFPSPLDIPRLSKALEDAGTLYPVIEGSFMKKPGTNEYFIRCAGKSIQVEEAISEDMHAFSTLNVIQPSLKTYVTDINVATQLDNPDAHLLSVKVTTFASGECALGLCWAHIMGDAHAFSTFTKALSDLYSGTPLDEITKPTFEPHVKLHTPRKEVLDALDIPQVWPSFPLREGWAMYGKAAEQSDMVQVNFTSKETQLLKKLASGDKAEEWISEQDALSSYWISILRLSGVPIETVCNSINYRSFFPNHPSFPPNLPTLVANVAQMWREHLPPSQIESQPSLRPIAAAIRSGLSKLRSDPDFATEWLSCRAFRMQETCDRGETQCLVPVEGDCMVNSNARYDWNIPFGFDPQTTRYHTSFSTLHFLRVFRCNPGVNEQIECTWNMKKGLAEKVLAEIERDRKEGWSRWRVA